MEHDIIKKLKFLILKNLGIYPIHVRIALFLLLAS